VRNGSHCPVFLPNCVSRSSATLPCPSMTERTGWSTEERVLRSPASGADPRPIKPPAGNWQHHFMRTEAQVRGMPRPPGSTRPWFWAADWWAQVAYGLLRRGIR
jgi:hypothetical protein